MGIQNRIGPPVEGENFFGRERELAQAWQLLQQGNSLLLAAPRRVGKSSFAKKLLGQALAKNWKTLYIDLEEIRTEKAFIHLFIEKLQSSHWWEKSKAKIGDLANQILGNLKSDLLTPAAQLSVSWQPFRSDLFTKLKKLLEHEEDTLIVIDELVIFLNNLLKNEQGSDDVQYFLNWLRSLRQVSGTKIRWIFCSSISIDNFTQIHHLSHTLNDVSSFPLGEFTPGEADEILNQLSQSAGINFPSALRSYLLGKLKWNLPYFIQISFAQMIRHSYSHPTGEPTTATIDEAYQWLVNDKCLNTWDERLKEYLGYEKTAREILGRLAQDPTGRTREQLYTIIYNSKQDNEDVNSLLSQILNMLKHDGYILLNKKKYIFRSPLLRDFWYNRFIS